MNFYLNLSQKYEIKDREILRDRAMFANFKRKIREHWREV